MFYQIKNLTILSMFMVFACFDTSMQAAEGMTPERQRILNETLFNAVFQNRADSVEILLIDVTVVFNVVFRL